MGLRMECRASETWTSVGASCAEAEVPSEEAAYAKSVLDKGMNFPFLSVSLNCKILHVRSECFPSSAQVAVWRRAMPMMIEVNSVMGPTFIFLFC